MNKKEEIEYIITTHLSDMTPLSLKVCGNDFFLKSLKAKQSIYFNRKEAKKIFNVLGIEFKEEIKKECKILEEKRLKQ